MGQIIENDHFFCHEDLKIRIIYQPVYTSIGDQGGPVQLPQLGHLLHGHAQRGRRAGHPRRVLVARRCAYVDVGAGGVGQAWHQRVVVRVQDILGVAGAVAAPVLTRTLATLAATLAVHHKRDY